MHMSIRSLAAVFAFAVMPLILGLLFSPTQAIADVTVALDVPPLVERQPGQAPGGETITLTNLRSGSTHGGRLGTGGTATIEDVPPGYYQVRITGNGRYHIDYIKVDAKGNAQLRYKWRELSFTFASFGENDSDLVNNISFYAATAWKMSDKEAVNASASSLRELQAIHRQALKRLESLGPKAIRAVGPPRFNTWRLLHQNTISEIDAAYDQATRAPASAGTESTSERRAALEEQQSQLEQQKQSQTAEIATFTPSFLERRQYLLEKLPPTLQTNLTRGGGTDPAGHAAVTRTRLQIQIELQEAANMDATVAADLTRLKILYDSMAAYYTTLFDTEAKIAQVQKQIAHTIVDEKDYATGGGDGGGGGEGGGGGN